MKKTRYILILVLLLAGCGPRENAADQLNQAPVTSVSIPEFNADSAYAYVEKQVMFGPRVPGSDAHTACAAWLAATLEKFADTLIIQEFKARAYNNSTLRGKNFIASFKPENSKRVLLCAHWDSRPYADHDPDNVNHKTPIDGANDGASGVGVLIELARQFSLQKPGIGVDIILFDLEDYGPPQDAQKYEGTDYWGLGSQYWSNTPHKMNYRARFGILLDMVGVKDATFLKEGYSLMYAPSKVKKVWDMADAMGYSDYFADRNGGYITDDHYYINKIANIPTVNIIHLDNNSPNGSFFSHWHTVSDNMDYVDKATLQVVGRVVMSVVYLEKI